MELTIPLAYGVLAVVAVAVVVFFVTWSRRSKPTQPEPERPTRHVEPDRDASDLPWTEPAGICSARASRLPNSGEPAHVSRADDNAHSPLFFTAGDGTRHVVMPMVLGTEATGTWKPQTDAAPIAAEVEPEPAPVPPAESAYRPRDAANEHRLTKRAERRAAAEAGTIAHDAPVCATCDTQGDPADSFCSECGSPFGEPAPVSITRPTTTPYALAAYSPKNQERILTACPHATEVRTFHGWLAAGRVVMKGQKGIRIVAPDTIDEGKVTRIKPLYLFDVSQTQPLAREDAGTTYAAAD
jgi:hypothetical protein